MEQNTFDAPDGYDGVITDSFKDSPEGLAIAQTVAPKNKPFYTNKTFIHYAVLSVIFAVITLLTPVILPEFPLFSVVPAAFLLVYIFLTRRIF